MNLRQISGNQSLADKIVNTNSDMMYAGVVAGNNNGVIWADDIFKPAFCMVWSEHLEGFHFMGSCYSHINKDELRAFIDSIIIGFLKNKNIQDFEFSCDSQNWFPFVCEVLSNREISSYKQYVYKLTDAKNMSQDIVSPVGYDVFEINKDFLCGKVKSIENPEMVQVDIEKTWGSIPNYIEHGMGFIAIQNNRICSFTTSHFKYNDIYSIGTETLEPHRKKGLSSFLSVQLFNSIIKANGKIWWDCSADNVASQKTARKTGLTFSHKYEVLWFKI